ncbi:MAG: hypothetical protein LBE86_13300 [Gemmobacter sp.]|jgi:hypothetical protein|nr:hypothetical protein [Gemmobacter sp.]
MTKKEFGDFYIELVHMKTPDGRDASYYKIGKIMLIEGVKRYHESSYVSAITYDEAIEKGKRLVGRGT